MNNHSSASPFTLASLCLLLAPAPALAQAKPALDVLNEDPDWLTLVGTPRGSVTIKDWKGSTVGTLARTGDPVQAAEGRIPWAFSPRI